MPPAMQPACFSAFRPAMNKAHMKTTRVRSIAAAARGSTLLLPLDNGASDATTLSPINLPWATLMSTNSAYPSFDMVDDQILIGRKAPCGLIVNHQAISGIHCRIVRKPKEDAGTKPVEETKTPSANELHSITEDDDNEERDDDDNDTGTSSHANNHRRSPIEARFEESKEAAAAIIDDKMRRKSRIKVKDMVNIFSTNSLRDQLSKASTGSDDGDSDAVVWKGSKNSTIVQRNSCMQNYEIWLEDLSTNGTYISLSNDTQSLTKIGNGNKCQLRNGTEFTLLVPNSQCHDRISFIVRVNGESPVGDSVDDAPTESVTMVFTDIESSTSLWEAAPDAMNTALEEHDRTLRTLLARFRGYEVKTEGDAFMVAFFTVLDAVKWCLAVQEAFLRMKWPKPILDLPAGAREFLDSNGIKSSSGSDSQLIFNGLRVRMGLHVGAPNCRRNPTTKRMDYYGPMVNLSARVSDAAYGGQIVCTEEVCKIVQDEVARMKEKAEKEWAEEVSDNEHDDEDECEDGGDAGSINSLGVVHHGHQRSLTPLNSFNSSTPPASIHSTANEDQLSVISQQLTASQLSPHGAPRSPWSPRSPTMGPVAPSPRSAQSKAMDAQRFQRIKAEVAKKPTTLDNTLDFLTDLNAVTFIDCGSVPLKGIHGLTRIYQISSASMTGRRWDPPLRAKGMVSAKDREIELGQTAPPPPPLTITFYTKHNIPLQIRRAIIKNKKAEKEIASRSQRSSLNTSELSAMSEAVKDRSKGDTDTITTEPASETSPRSEPAPTFAMGSAPVIASSAAAEPDPVTFEPLPKIQSPSALKKSAGRASRGSVRFADEPLLQVAAKANAAKTAIAVHQNTEKPAIAATNSSSSSGPNAAVVTAVSTHESVLRSVASRTFSGSSALAASILAARERMVAESAVPTNSAVPAKSVEESSTSEPTSAPALAPTPTTNTSEESKSTRAPKLATSTTEMSKSARVATRDILAQPSNTTANPTAASTLTSSIKVAAHAERKQLSANLAINTTQANIVNIAAQALQPNKQQLRVRSHDRRPSRSADLAAEACFAAFDAEIRTRSANKVPTGRAIESMSAQPWRSSRQSSAYGSLRMPLEPVNAVNYARSVGTFDRQTAQSMQAMLQHQQMWQPQPQAFQPVAPFYQQPSFYQSQPQPQQSTMFGWPSAQPSLPPPSSQQSWRGPF